MIISLIKFFCLSAIHQNFPCIPTETALNTSCITASVPSSAGCILHPLESLPSLVPSKYSLHLRHLTIGILT